MAPLIVFLANRERLTQDRIHADIRTWLDKHGAFENVRFVPSRRRREQVHADVSPSIFLDTEQIVDTARLEIGFEFPANAAYDYYRIQWVQPDERYSVGWHQDDHRDELGECHLQLDHRDEVVDVRGAEFLDTHPLNVLETRLTQLPEILEELTWVDDVPQFG